MQGPGEIICPILLYHRIAPPSYNDPYYVTPEEFRAQMQALKDWGYTTITATQLVNAINVGSMLPQRPVVISFDDGDNSVFSQAFPIMREFGFVGVNYLVSKYIGAEGYMSIEQINELGVAGWEIGSHSISHADLTTLEHPEWEIIQSQERLAKMFDWPINTFAYPFGKETYDIRIMVSRNYIAGMGLGVTVKQRPGILYYLSRRPVPLHTTIETFGTYLPWNTPPGQ
jgi:peptidoglycan/xylan/chitin deacetylase (PgdA/CDA1 family)